MDGSFLVAFIPPAAVAAVLVCWVALAHPLLANNPSYDVIAELLIANENGGGFGVARAAGETVAKGGIAAQGLILL